MATRSSKAVMPKSKGPAVPSVETLPAEDVEVRIGQLLVLLLVTLGALVFIGWGITNSLFVGSLLGSLATILVAWKTRNLYMITVATLKVVVVLDLLTGKHYRFTRGLWFIPPWCRLQFIGDSRRELRIQSGPNEFYTSEDGVKFEAGWLIVMQLRLQDILKFIKTPEETIATDAAAIVTTFLTDKIATMKAMTVIGSKAELSHEASLLFCGVKKMSDFEEKNGVNMGNPKLFKLTPGADDQKAMSGQFKARMLRKQMAILGKEVDPKIRLEAAQINSGEVKKTVSENKIEFGENLGKASQALGEGLLSLLAKFINK